MVQTLNKWGNSLGLRIPESIARKKIGVGDKVEIVATEQGILVKPQRKKMTYQELVDSIPDDYEMEDLIPNILPSEEW